jgi:hypothetical protein
MPDKTEAEGPLPSGQGLCTQEPEACVGARSRQSRRKRRRSGDRRGKKEQPAYTLLMTPPEPPTSAAAWCASSTIHQRHGDRASGDDSDCALPVYCRFRALVKSNIASNWPQLLRMIDGEGFPAGIMLSPNVRVWEVSAVRRWLATRPSARKAVPPRRQSEELSA